MLENRLKCLILVWIMQFSHSVMTNPQSRWWNKSGFSSRIISFLLGKLKLVYLLIPISHISHENYLFSLTKKINLNSSVVTEFYNSISTRVVFLHCSSFPLYKLQIVILEGKQLLKDSWPSIWLWRRSFNHCYLTGKSIIERHLQSSSSEKSQRKWIFLFKTPIFFRVTCFLENLQSSFNFCRFQPPKISNLRLGSPK